MQYQSQQAPDRSAHTNFAGRFVFPYDAEDLKAHRWFKGVPWDRLHDLDPPFVPMIRSPDDTQYFDDEEPLTDFSDSDEDDDDAEEEQEDRPSNDAKPSTGVVGVDAAIGRDGANDNTPTVPPSHSLTSSVRSTAVLEKQSTPRSERSPTREEGTPAPAAPTAASSKKRVERNFHLTQALKRFDRNIQEAVHAWLAVPYDSIRLRNFEMQVDAEVGLQASERDALKALVRVYGRKEKKRPRDKLLRDPSTRKVVLQERKKSAFLGYD